MRAGRLVQRPLIQDEGRLVQQRQARRHENELYEPYRTLSTKNLHSTALFMEIQELGEDQGARLRFIDLASGLRTKSSDLNGNWLQRQGSNLPIGCIQRYS